MTTDNPNYLIRHPRPRQALPAVQPDRPLWTGDLVRLGGVIATVTGFLCGRLLCRVHWRDGSREYCAVRPTASLRRLPGYHWPAGGTRPKAA